MFSLSFLPKRPRRSPGADPSRFPCAKFFYQLKESLPGRKAPSRALLLRGGGEEPWPRRDISPHPARRGRIFRRPRPVDFPARIWHNVHRRPPGGFQGLVIGLVRLPGGRLFPLAAFSRFLGLAEGGLVLIFCAPLKGAQKNKTNWPPSALGFGVVFCFVFSEAKQNYFNPIGG